MTSYPPAPSQPPVAPQHFPPLPPLDAQPRTWFARNWKWFVPVIITTVVVMFIGFIAAIFYGVSSMMTSSDAYKVAVKRALASPAVQARLGTPIKVGRFTTGSINLNGINGDASLGIPLHGPRGDATLVVEAKKHANRWTYDTLEVQVDGDEKSIPLSDDAPTPSPPSPPSSSAAPDSST